MTDHRKTPTAGFWITVALVALLVYVLSVGPACWLLKKNSYPDWGFQAYTWIYAPFCYLPCPEPLRSLLQWYIGLWTR